MTRSGLAPSPRAVASRANPPSPSAPPSGRSGGGGGRDRPSYERILAWSLLASVVVHLLFLLAPFSEKRVEPAGPMASAPQAERSFGMQMIVAVPSENAPDLPAVEERAPAPAVSTPPPLRAPQPRPEPAGAGAERPTDLPNEAEPGAGSVRDVLQPGYRDPRLYAPSNDFPELEKSEHERYLEHLQARIDAVNDSIGVAAQRNRRTSDWTVTDGSGNKWGLSPEGLHLGGITVPRGLLPLPAPTGDNQSLEAERERQRMREEIERQEEATDRSQRQRERIEEMRERREPR